MPFVKEKKGRGTRLVDHERGLTFYYKQGTGGSSRMLNVFELDYQGQEIPFIVEPSFKSDDELNYNILKIVIPSTVKADEAYILSIIKEAFDVYGYFGNQVKTINVRLALEPNL